MGLSGISTWGSDIGGFFTLSEPAAGRASCSPAGSSSAPSPASCGRRPRASACRASARPQVWEDETLPIYRRYAKLRTQLYPYLRRGRSQRIGGAGMPIMRHLSLAYPDDRRRGGREDQFLVRPRPDGRAGDPARRDQRAALRCRRGAGSTSGARLTTASATARFASAGTPAPSAAAAMELRQRQRRTQASRRTRRRPIVITDEVSQRRRRRVRPAHPVHAGAGRGRGGADVDAGDPGRVGVERQARADHDLDRRVGAGDDVAADVVGVVGLELGRGAGRAWRRSARAGRARSARSASITARSPSPDVAVRHVGVGPDRDGRRRPSARGSARYCWATRTNGRSGIRPRLTSRSACDDLLEGADDVDGAGPAARLRRPRHAALDREVDLEGARPVPVAAVGARDPGGQPVPGELGDARGGQVERDDVGVELGEGADPRRRSRSGRRARAARRLGRR